MSLVSRYRSASSFNDICWTTGLVRQHDSGRSTSNANLNIAEGPAYLSLLKLLRNPTYTKGNVTLWLGGLNHTHNARRDRVTVVYDSSIGPTCRECLDWATDSILFSFKPDGKGKEIQAVELRIWEKEWGNWPSCSIQVGLVDEAELGVGPVELLLLEVDGQSVGPIDLLVDNDLSIAAIHSRPFYSRLLPPVGPIHVPEKKNKATVSWIPLSERKRVKSSQPVIQNEWKYLVFTSLFARSITCNQ